MHNPLYPELARFLRGANLTAAALFARHDKNRAQALTFAEAAALLREACPSAGQREFVRDFLSREDADRDGLVRAADFARAVAPAAGRRGGESEGEEWLPVVRELRLLPDGGVGGGATAAATQGPAPSTRQRGASAGSTRPGSSGEASSRRAGFARAQQHGATTGGRGGSGGGKLGGGGRTR